MQAPDLVLASTSPRRAELLRTLGARARVLDPDLPERESPGETPTEHALRLAAGKAQAVAARIGASPPALVLGADTIVTLDGAILGKPVDAPDAERMLRLLSGRTHEVLTAVHLLRTDLSRSAGTVEASRVRFRTYGDDTIRRYLASQEPWDKAGAYSIQGLGVLLTLGIEGSWSNVVGLPLEALPALCREVGVDLWDYLE